MGILRRVTFKAVVIGSLHSAQHHAMTAIHTFSQRLSDSAINRVTSRAVSAIPRLQRGVQRDDRISPARCSEVRVQLQSLDFTETHRRARYN